LDSLTQEPGPPNPQSTPTKQHVCNPANPCTLPHAGFTAHQLINHHHHMLSVGFAALQASALARLQLPKVAVAQHNEMTPKQAHAYSAKAVLTKVCRLLSHIVVHDMK
jgi:hypothetical protein